MNMLGVEDEGGYIQTTKTNWKTTKLNTQQTQEAVYMCNARGRVKINVTTNLEKHTMYSRRVVNDVYLLTAFSPSSSTLKSVPFTHKW